MAGGFPGPALDNTVIGGCLWDHPRLDLGTLSLSVPQAVSGVPGDVPRLSPGNATGDEALRLSLGPLRGLIRLYPRLSWVTLGVVPGLFPRLSSGSLGGLLRAVSPVLSG